MAQPAFILILSSDGEKGRHLRDLLHDRAGHSCRVVGSLTEAMESIRDRVPDVVVADTRVGGESTCTTLANMLDEVARDATLLALGDGQNAPRTRHIVYQQLPDGDVSELVEPISRAARKAVARREDRLIRESLGARPIEAFEGIVGQSPAIQRIIARIRKAARTKLTVLIVGETGTGKELIAKAIHRCSDRSARPMKELNCAGFNENLLESALFGHVKGAFTGAISDAKGYFVAADGGTLFLDEVGDMPLPMQAKLLRALEQREVTPVGSTDVRRVDVRVVAATHQDLPRLVEEGRFRADLYYRLNQWEIKVPPLRERREDIPLLAHYLLERANRTHGVRASGISAEAMLLLTRYHWPGNVRELANVIESVACEVVDRPIEADDLPEHLRGSREIVPVSSLNLVGLTMDQIERLAIERTLAATGGNREQAAKILNIGTRTLYRKIKEYGL